MSSSRQKKKLNNTNPRRNPVKKQKKKSRLDRVTLLLGITAVILLILVIIFMNRNAVDALFPGLSETSRGDNQPPVIERVQSNESQTAVQEPVTELGDPQPTSGSDREENPPETPEEDRQNKTATARLFFIRVSDEGNISMKSVLRSVPASASPLTTSIRALLEGPRPNELSNDVLSLIPEKSELIGARIENGIAFLDFNEQFRFNALGIEGYESQVEQIVYTATEFPTVQKVQFLIEGQRIEYLGGEGFWVGGPLGREDF